MKSAYLIAGRELRTFFLSPTAQLVLTVWLLWCGMHYYLLTVHYSQSAFELTTGDALSAFFGGTTLFFMPLLVFVPVLTMRLIAEERTTGTLENLLTVPVSEWQVVWGKYIAAMVMWLVLWVPTLVYVWISSAYGELDKGQVLASYVGILGIGVQYMAIGLLMSAASRTQIIAALLTFMVLGLLFVIGLGEFLFDDELRREICGYISVWGHMDAFSKGIVDSRYLVFDVSLACAALFFATRRLELRRWSS